MTSYHRKSVIFSTSYRLTENEFGHTSPHTLTWAPLPPTLTWAAAPPPADRAVCAAVGPEPSAAEYRRVEDSRPEAGSLRRPARHGARGRRQSEGEEAHETSQSAGGAPRQRYCSWRVRPRTVRPRSGDLSPGPPDPRRALYQLS